MKPSLFIIEQSAKELAKITQKPCYLDHPNHITESFFHLEVTYAPVSWQEAGLHIHLLLRFYAPKDYNQELLLEDLITSTCALQHFQYLRITQDIEATIHHQSVKESKAEAHLKASWLMQVHFNPQERELLLQLLRASSA